MAILEKVPSSNQSIANAVKPKKKGTVYDSIRDKRGRDKITRVLEYFRKFAVDSALDQSLKAVSDGTLVDKIVKERPKDPNSSPYQKNKISLVVADEVHARIEKKLDHVNCTALQTDISTQSRPVLICFEDLPKEPTKGSSTEETPVKRIFIRSRL